MKLFTKYFALRMFAISPLVFVLLNSCFAVAMTNSATTYANKALDFKACAQAGLENSPILNKSSIEITIRRLNEADARWDYAPSLYVDTSYYVTRPSYVSDPVNFGVSTGPYDVIQPYFANRAAKEFTRIAILVHLRTVTDGLHECGKLFLEIDCLDQALTIQNEIIQLAEQNKETKNAMRNLANDSLVERQIAEMKLEKALVEKTRLLTLKSSLTEHLLSFLGLPIDSQITVITTNAYNQVTQRFDPNMATLSQAMKNSTEIEIYKLKKKLQEMNILAAYAKYIPSPVISMRSADPLANSTDSGLFLTVGINFLVWDGFDRRRNITRQKEILKQYDLDYQSLEQTITIQWREVANNNRIAFLNLKAAKTESEVTRLEAEQSRIRHESGNLPIDKLNTDRTAYLLAKKDENSKNLDYNLSVLHMRYLSGNLTDSFIDTKAFSAAIRESGNKGGNRQ